MVERGQALAGEFRIRRGFEPADARDRIIAAALRECADLPRRRAGPAGRIPKPRHGFIEGQDTIAARKGVLPVLRISIPSRIDEPLIGGVGDFELIDPEIRQRDAWRQADLIRQAGHEHHAGRGVGDRSKFHGASSELRAHLERFVAGLRDPDAVVRERESKIAQGGGSDGIPLAGHVVVVADLQLRTGRLRHQ